MNSIFRKTLIASSLSIILSTAAVAEDDYKSTIDGTSADEKGLNNQQDNSSNNRSDSNQNYSETIDGKKAPCNDDMKGHNQSKNQDMDKSDSQDRPLTDHQGNVTEQSDDMKATGQSKNRDMNQLGEKDRPLTDHQGNVIEEEEEEEEIIPRVSDEETNNTEIDRSDETEMNVQMEESSDSYKNDQAGKSAPTSNLYSMSADELIGMEVVANDDEDIGHISSIVLSPDQSEVHAVITVGSILGMGGRDVLASLDELTLVNDQLRIKADEDDIAAMNDYGSEDFVELEGDAALSTAIRAK